MLFRDHEKLRRRTMHPDDASRDRIHRNSNSIIATFLARVFVARLLSLSLSLSLASLVCSNAHQKLIRSSSPNIEQIRAEMKRGTLSSSYYPKFILISSDNPVGR